MMRHASTVGVVLYLSFLVLTLPQPLAAKTSLGVGTGALLGGDLTDPQDNIDDSIPGGVNYNWISAGATSEPWFSPGTGSEAAFDVFDNKVGGGEAKWCCAAPMQAVWVEFDRTYQLTHFTIAAGNDTVARDPTVWFIEGSNDGTNWTTIFEYNNPGVTPFAARLEVLRFDVAVDFPTPAFYSHFRYRVSQTNGVNFHQISEIELFGTPPESIASYNAGTGAPECTTVGDCCDSGTILVRSGSMTPVETNQPNTLGPCIDGSFNIAYQVDESIEKIVVSGGLQKGSTARVDVTVYAWNDGSDNVVELFQTGTGDDPNATMTPIAVLQPTRGGLQTLSAEYTLPAGTLHRIQAIIRDTVSTPAEPCTGEGFYDREDLLFAVCPVDLATRFETRKAQVIDGLQQLDPNVTALTTEQDQDLNAIYDHYVAECQANPLTVEARDMEKEILASIRVFHVEAIYDEYLPRMTSTSEQDRLREERDSATYASLVEEGYDLQQADYVAAAQRGDQKLRAAFQRIIHDRVCQDCSPTPDAGDIHQALFWAGLAYEEFADITSRVGDGLTQLAVYSSSQMLYQEQEHVNPITHDGLPSFFSNVYSRAFIAALARSDGTTDIVIAFRGTDPTSEDTITDLEVPLRTYDEVTVSGLDGTPKVHLGFHAMWKEHRQGMLAAIDSYVTGLPNELDDVRTIYVTGHSLGAAVATVSIPGIATHLQDNYGLNDPSRLKMINFGSPRTGNLAWTKLFKEKAGLYSYARVWNSLDIVQTIPIELMGYRHIDSSIKLPTLPDRHLWPHSWWTYWTGIDKARDFWESEGIGDVRHHGIPAYQFNVVRNLIDLPILEELPFRRGECIAIQNGVLYRYGCETKFRYACEVLESIALNDGGVGVDSISWTNRWVNPGNLGQNPFNGVECNPLDAVFSAPARQQDLDDLEALYALNSAWVNSQTRSFF